MWPRALRNLVCGHFYLKQPVPGLQTVDSQSSGHTRLLTRVTLLPRTAGTGVRTTSVSRPLTRLVSAPRKAITMLRAPFSRRTQA